MLIVHGWNDDPSRGWLGWIGDALRDRGCTVYAPHLKINERPLLKQWSRQLHPYVEKLGAEDIIIAHSLGCFLTLRMLERLSLAKPIRKIIFVSGFYDAPNDSAGQFFSPEPNWPHIQSQAMEFICLASDNDTVVTPDRTRRLAYRLDAEMVVLADKGHFLGSRGMDTLPEIMELID